LGSQYVLGLNAVNCHNGDVLAQQQVTANGKEQVLKALGDAATKLREKLGESLASVQKYDAPPQNVTTPSLEALQAYSLGVQEMNARSDYAAAIPLFQRAVSLDPDFAMAYARLGTDFANLGEGARADGSTRKAYELRGRTSEREQFYITSHYEDYATGNLEAARTDYELWAQTYPRDTLPYNNLGGVYERLGEYEKALTAAQAATKLGPGNALGYARLVYEYRFLNRFDEAKATAQAAHNHNLDGPFIHHNLYLIDFLQHDATGLERETAILMGRPGYEDFIFSIQADTAAYGGGFAKALELTHHAVDSAQRSHEKETAAGYQAQAAVREAWIGDMIVARQEAQDALTLSNGEAAEALSAVALGLAGDTDQAARLAGDLDRRFAEDTVVRLEYLPMIHAAIALRASDSRKAIDALAAAAPYESGVDAQLNPVYLRGEAELAAKQGAAAVVEFQKVLDHPGVVANHPIGALAHLGLGRAYALAGDNAKAKTAYQDFFALWKNADPDVPILKQAKAEYAKLK
jgi:tetratricopeptide (TPR) repeat protein